MTVDFFASDFEAVPEAFETLETMSAAELFAGIKRLEHDPDLVHSQERKRLALFQLFIRGELERHPNWKQEVNWTGADCGLAGCGHG